MNGYRFYVFKIANEGKRSYAAAAWAKAEGLLAGVWDIFVTIPTAHYHGLYIEFKAGKNTLTEAQEEFGNRVTNLGYLCLVHYDWEDAVADFKRYIKGEKFDGREKISSEKSGNASRESIEETRDARQILSIQD